MSNPSKSWITELALKSVFDGSVERSKSADDFRKAFLWAVLVGIGYAVGTRVGFALTPRTEPIAAFWPPNAMLLAGFLLIARRHWWLLLLAVLPAHLLVQLGHGVPLIPALGWFVSNTAEAVLGAYLITEAQEPAECFEHVRGLVVFLALGVIGAPLLTSFLDAAVVVGTGMGRGYWLLWTVRLVSNMLAGLTVVPTVVLFGLYGPEWFRKADWKKYAEAAGLVLVVAFISRFAFASRDFSNGQFQLLYILLPVLLWASLRFGLGGLSATLLTISIVSAWCAVRGVGPFSSESAGHTAALQLFLCSLALPFMFLGVLLAQQKETTTSLRQSQMRLIDSQEQERRRIARELHDGVGQSLALLEIEAAQLVEDFDYPEKSKLDSFIRQLSEVSEITREISHGLHPSQLEYLGLAGALERLCREITKEHRVLDVEFIRDGLPEDLDSDISLSLYRVAQEALHNAAKYSGARHIYVRLCTKEGQVRMEVADDGIGFVRRRKEGHGIGLDNMRERMELIGGRLSIESAPYKGTSVQASVPVKRAAA